MHRPLTSEVGKILLLSYKLALPVLSVFNNELNAYCFLILPVFNT